MTDQSSSSTKPRRVARYKLLGARRTLGSLGGGAILGSAVASIVASMFAGRGSAPIGLCFFFGLFFGPMLTLFAALLLVETGFSREDFSAAGWSKLITLGLLGLTLGVLLGFIVGNIWIRVTPAGDLIVLMWMVVSGTAGVLVPSSLVVWRAAKRRRASESAPRRHLMVSVIQLCAVLAIGAFVYRGLRIPPFDAPSSSFRADIRKIGTAIEHPPFSRSPSSISTAVGQVSGQSPQRIAHVSPSYWSTPPVKPVLGRNFLEEEYLQHSAVVLLNYAYWSTQLKGDPNVIGGELHVEGKSYTIVGVMPQWVNTPRGVMAWIPGL